MTADSHAAMAAQAETVVPLRVPMSPAAWAVVAEAAREFTGAVRVVVLRFEPTAGDLSRLGAPPGREPASERAIERALAAFSRPDLVWVAVLAEPADATAAVVALGCDLRVFSADAGIALSGAAALGGLGALAGLVGYARALELSLTARRMSAAEARAVGVANLVVDADQVDAAVDDLVTAILATPRALAIETKALLLAREGSGFAARLADERETRAAIDRLAGTDE